MSVEYFGRDKWPQAIVIRKDEKVDGISFYSPTEFPQQIGLMSRRKGHVVERHFHNIAQRTIDVTQEVLLIRNGSCIVSLYDDQGEILATIKLSEGDVILLAHGGHGIEMLEDTEILEIKQGPYSAQDDKRHF
jgi:oxalate decarboxylase/phosphoglucose isomerase-like protein (cupin superfamily)